jgi:transcriptional antiterminator NusG
VTEDPDVMGDGDAPPAPVELPEADGLDGEDESGIRLNPVPQDGVRRRWYALHAHSGQEANVQNMLLAAAELEGLSDLITNVLVPMEENMDQRPGSKAASSRKSYPGYVLVQLPEHPERYAELWHMIKDTPGVTGFIGSRTLPVPLEDSEIEEIVEVSRGEKERPKPKVEFDEGERVKIIDGSFANFIGKIDEINADRGNMKVMVEIFERLTSVEVEFWQVERV